MLHCSIRIDDGGQLAADQARLEKRAAVREGRVDTVDAIPSSLPPEFEDAARAMMYDADVFRAVLETNGCLALPQEVFARPGLWEKVKAVARRLEMPPEDVVQLGCEGWSHSILATG